MELTVDSTATIEMLNSGKTTDMDSLSLVKQIMRLIKTIGEVKVTRIYRKTNYCADVLPKFGAISGEDFIFGEEFFLESKHYFLIIQNNWYNRSLDLGFYTSISL